MESGEKLEDNAVDLDDVVPGDDTPVLEAEDGVERGRVEAWAIGRAKYFGCDSKPAVDFA